MEYNIIYGAGVYGEIFCKTIESQGINIEYFVDEYTPKTTLAGKKIKRLKEVSLENSIIYISITSPMAEVEVIQTLKKLKAKKIYTFIETLHKFPSLVSECVMFTKTWWTPELKQMVETEKIETFKTLLNDQKSIDLLDSIVQFRTHLTAKDYPSPDLEPQYFPSDINLFEHLDFIRFIDGGAYIGDTISEALVGFDNANKKVDYIASFEPEKRNIALLSEEVKKQNNLHPDINFFVYPCGLWSSNAILEFTDNCGSSSSLMIKTAQNKIQIPTVKLDETFIAANPNYIKMDIEGAEAEAIIGATELIKKSSPVLAICLYHKPKDLWELPLLINAINPNYNMYLRLYGSMGLELVLYCVPKAH